MDLNKVPLESKWRKPNYVAMLKIIEEHRTGKILDIGCGRGELTQALGNSYGIDINQFSTWGHNPPNISPSFWKNPNFNTYDGINPPKKKFGTIVFNNSFEHIKEKQKLIHNLKKQNPTATILLVLPTQKYLLSRYLYLPKAIIKRSLLRQTQSIHDLIVHESNIYGWNFIKEWNYYSNWTNRLKQYFIIEQTQELDSGKHLFIKARFK